MRALAALLLCACAAAPRPMRFAEPTHAPPAFPPDRLDNLTAALPDVEKLVDGAFVQAGVPGLAVGLVVDGKLLWSKSYGARDLEAGAAVTAKSVFRIASMTKSFTAVAILRLRDEGKLRLDDPVERWVPGLSDLPYPTRDSRRITIRDLLTHAAGFPEDNASGDHTLDWTTEELLARLKAGPLLSSSAGVQFEYANLGFEILGLVVERAGGEPYTAYVTRHVLRPLGMSVSVWDQKDVPREHAVVGYGRRPPDRALAPEVQLGPGAGSPMGGLYTSLADLSRYVAWQLDAWPPRDDPDDGPLSRASRREMQTGWRPFGMWYGAAAAGEPTIAAGGYGYGLLVLETCRFGQLVEHSGGLPGFGTDLTWLPDRGVGVIVLANQTYASTWWIGAQIFDLLDDKDLLPARALPASPALAAMRDRAVALLEAPDEAKVRALYDRELLEHLGAAALVSALEKVHARHPDCAPEGEIAAENALRGGFTLACARDEVEVEVELTTEGKLQALRFREKVPPSKAQKKAARALAKMLSSSTGGVEAIAAKEADVARMKAVLGAYHARGCAVGDLLEGDGAESAAFRVKCGEESLTLRFELDGAGKVRTLDVQQSFAGKCP